MAKRRKVKRPASRRVARKPAAKKRGPGVSIKIKKNPRFLKRAAALGVNLVTIDETLLSMFFELGRKHRKIGEAAYLYDAAILALYAKAEVSDDPEEWLKAARKAAHLD